MLDNNYIHLAQNLITYLDKRKEDKKERLDIELGVAVAESNTGIKVNYDKVTLLDILSGQGSRKDWGEESFSFGNKKVYSCTINSIGSNT